MQTTLMSYAAHTKCSGPHTEAQNVLSFMFNIFPFHESLNCFPWLTLFHVALPSITHGLNQTRIPHHQSHNTSSLLTHNLSLITSAKISPNFLIPHFFMAHLLATNPNTISLKLFFCSSGSSINAVRSGGYYNATRKRHRLRSSSSRCSTSSSSVASAELQIEKQREENGEKEGRGRRTIISVIDDDDHEREFLVCENGWRVRRLVEKDEEIRNAANVQAEAFHVPVSLFNPLFFQFFQAEVLAGLLYKLNNSPQDRYACLVAEAATTNSSSNSSKQLVGVVDVTAMRDENVLQHLPPQAPAEYLYISGIAVSFNFRRRKVATALLRACDVLSELWGFDFLALRAYEEDWGARNLYSKAGYKVVSRDPPWLSTWIGKKCRVLMIKQTSKSTSNLTHM